VLLALLSLFWGLAWPAMKIVLGEIRPWTFRAICLAAGGAGLLALARAGGAACGCRPGISRRSSSRP